MSVLVELVDSLKSLLPQRNYRYSTISQPLEPVPRRRRGQRAEDAFDIWSQGNRRLLKLSMGAMFLVVILYMTVAFRLVLSASTG